MASTRYAQVWLPGYLKNRVRSWWRRSEGSCRVWLAIADHYEPFWKNADDSVARRRVAAWTNKWPEIAARHADAAGKPPKYSFFYAEEEYRPHLLEPLAAMTRAEIADVEVHIHHNGEGERNFVDRIGGFTETLFSRHGLLRKRNGRIDFGFIHGNWALDNSRDGDWCGLNNELQLLRDLGCYADFTMPSGPSPTQARLVNTIYWATDDPEKPKSYDTGIPVTPGSKRAGDLLIIPGPFGLRWRERFPPRIEMGELAWHNPPTALRVRRWLDLAPRVGNDIFIKLFTHGTQEKNSDALLNRDLDETFRLVKEECTRRDYHLRFASAWEMYLAVETARAGI